MRDGDRFDVSIYMRRYAIEGANQRYTQPSIIRLGVLLLLFDVYLTWARIEKQSIPGIEPGESNLGKLGQQPIVFQYFFFCTAFTGTRFWSKANMVAVILCALSTIAFHVSIRFLVSSRFSPLNALGILPRYPRPNSVSTALLVSSSTKLFPILMVIWQFDVPAAAHSLGWAVVANNVEAVRILLDCPYYTACLLALVGAAARWGVGRLVMAAAGLDNLDSISDARLVEDGEELWSLLAYVREWGGRLAVG